MEKFKVNDHCINCKACERVAEANFRIEDKAIIFKQPENESEQKKCQTALEICPTNAIELVKPEVIIGESKVRETLEKYPELKEKLIELSPKFKTLQNPLMWRTMARFATFKDTEKMTGVSLCEILHFINKTLGIESLLEFPNCIKEVNDIDIDNSEPVTWEEPEMIMRMNDDETIKIIALIEDIKNLDEGQSIVFESNSVLRPVISIIEDLKLQYNLLSINPHQFRISIFKAIEKEWQLRTDEFVEIDVRNMSTDPLDEILKTAYTIHEGSGFTLVQTFVPEPMVNMLWPCLRCLSRRPVLVSCH